ncbi:hypothetical protein V6Z12_A12G173600 [Gossypium hirsutum]
MVLMYDINDRTKRLSQDVDTQRKIYSNASYTSFKQSSSMVIQA